MGDTTETRLERTIAAPPEQVWAALTERNRLQSWLCDQVLIEAQAGGRYLFRWRSGYEAQGTLIEFDPPEELTWAWQGLGEPGLTLVKWELEAEDKGTRVKLEHTGFGRDSRSRAARVEAAEGWAKGLENLQSVLEEGVDLRQARRPLMGVLLDNMSAERAEQEGIATTTGVYIAGVVEGAAAEAAGIQQGDVMVALGDYKLHTFSDLVTAMQAYKAGDKVAVALVRGQEQLTLEVELRGRPMPPAAASLPEAVARLREGQEQVRTALSEITAGLTDEQAAQAPAEGEWSVREILAHLSSAERDLQTNVLYLVVGFELIGDPDFSVAPDRNAVILAVEPTLTGLLARFDRDMEESALLVERLSPNTVADRYRYRQALELVFNFLNHTNDHVEQIRGAVETVRVGGA
jgi:uncharacterized protein YndB with AHSA1/START domain